MPNEFSTLNISNNQGTAAQMFGTGGSFSPFNYPVTPTFPTVQPVSNQSSGGGSKVDQYFNTVAALVSQYFNAYGKNPSTQISPSNSITGIANPNTIAGYQAAVATSQNQYQNQPGGGVGTQAVGTVTGLLDGVAQSFGISTTSLLLFGAAGIFLFTRTPSRR